MKPKPRIYKESPRGWWMVRYIRSSDDTLQFTIAFSWNAAVKWLQFAFDVGIIR